MALHLILGNSGAGKSDRLYEHILVEAGQHPKRTYYVLVPEQFTMATQREFVSRQKNHAILNVDVLSFKRLAYRVFEELGRDTLQVLEDTGKNLILRKLAADLEPRLHVLQGSLHRIGYIDEIKSFLTELAQYRIEPDTLSEMAQQPGVSPLLAAKLADIQMLYTAFLHEIEGDYLLAEEVVEYLAQLVPQSALFDDTVLVFDGFTGFTPVQQTFLEAVFPVVKDCYVALTIDAREDFFAASDVEQLFYLSRKTIHTLLDIAARTQVEVCEPTVLNGGEQCRFAAAPLLYHLEQNLFRLRQMPYAGEMDKQEQLHILGFAKPLDELRYAAQEIRRLIRSGLRYREIAIVSGEVELYASYVPQVFSEYEIPYFLDQTRPILFHPLMECVRGLLELAKTEGLSRGLSYESMMRVVKSGLLPIEPRQADLLENYVLACGICGWRQWKKLWTYCPKWLTAEELQQLNEIREQLMDVLDPYLTVMTAEDATVKVRTQALYDVMIAWRLSDGDPEGRIWRILMELFDKLVGLLGEEQLPLDEYADVLEAGFEGAEVAVIPPGSDQVLVGDIERTRLDHIKVLFFLGVNDGVIPRVTNEGGILSQPERQMLAQAHYELAPTARERAFIQRFYLYLNMTKPSERLYLTFAGRGADGVSRRRSYLIGMLLRMFPGLTVTDATLPSADLMSGIQTPGVAFRLLAEGLEDAKSGGASPEWRALFAWYGRQAQWQEPLARLLSAAFYHYGQEPLPADVSRMLYGTVLENSVTRLERFAACAYEHFLTYGLQLQPREEHTFEAVDFGNLVHSALEHYARGLAASDYDWFNAPEDVRHRIGDDAMQTAMAQTRNDALYASAKNRYLVTRIEHLLHQTVDTLTRQVRKGRFLPAAYEIGFGMAEHLDAAEFVLNEEERMRLRGRIDRVDVMDNGADTYVKIIDYKSGQTKFSLLSMYHGLQLQLVVYLNAAMELLRKRPHTGAVLPAGIFYYHVDEPVIQTEGETDEQEIWQGVFERLRLDGIVNADSEVYGAMDTEFTDRSDVIPVARTKSGDLSKTSKVYDTEQFQTMSEYVNQTILGLGKRMLAGEIAASPYELKGKNACTWCGYRSICGFDERLDGCSYRRLDRVGAEDEIFDQMQQALDQKKEGN